MKRLVLEKEGILYRNPRPGYQAVSAYLPNVLPLGREEVLCFYRTGQAFYSTDGRLARLRSLDAGQSWTEDGVVWDPRKDTQAFTYTAPHATRLSDGTLLLLARRFDASDPDRPFFNPHTGGTAASEAVLFRAPDDGHTWSPPEALTLPGEGVADTPSQIIELNGGRWFLACEQWKTWDDRRPLHIKGFAVFSEDGGRTWGDRIDFPSAGDSEKMVSHSRYTRMLDGRICALQWTQDIGGSRDFELHFTVSDDTGRRWSDPQPTGLAGQTSWVADLGEGVLAAAYTCREGMKPGIRVVLSEDEGKTWNADGELVVWDAVGQEYLGVQHKPSYPASHDNIAFGKPNLSRLPDGSLVAAWWCTQACVTHCRFAKVRVE